MKTKRKVYYAHFDVQDRLAIHEIELLTEPPKPHTIYVKYRRAVDKIYHAARRNALKMLYKEQVKIAKIARAHAYKEEGKLTAISTALKETL